jgi:hypothetical protein
MQFEKKCCLNGNTGVFKMRKNEKLAGFFRTAVELQ